jgi:hypothetical protein
VLDPDGPTFGLRGAAACGFVHTGGDTNLKPRVRKGASDNEINSPPHGEDAQRKSAPTGWAHARPPKRACAHVPLETSLMWGSAKRPTPSSSAEATPPRAPPQAPPLALVSSGDTEPRRANTRSVGARSWATTQGFMWELYGADASGGGVVWRGGVAAGAGRGGTMVLVRLEVKST